jgi:hypothetical protein
MSNAQRHSGEDEWAGLMARAQEGDAAAYRHLLAAIAPYLRALAARYHRVPQDMEDSVQDILLTVHAIRHTGCGAKAGSGRGRFFLRPSMKPLPPLKRTHMRRSLMRVLCAKLSRSCPMPSAER